jgi:hypothetical protein
MINLMEDTCQYKQWVMCQVLLYLKKGISYYYRVENDFPKNIKFGMSLHPGNLIILRIKNMVDGLHLDI